MLFKQWGSAMFIDILCTDKEHPVFREIRDWIEANNSLNTIRLYERVSELAGGDLLFLVSCHEIVSLRFRSLYTRSFVLHASDLPNGRGWSPHIWTILSGEMEIVVSLIEAEDRPDTGDIWLQRSIPLEGHELNEEINRLLFKQELEMIAYIIDNYESMSKRKQSQLPATYFRRRAPEDSRIDPHKSIADQFDLLRVADFNRYPAFFEYRGHRYYIRVSKST